MICISWNACGFGNEQSRTALDNLCISHKPNWVAIYEPKILKDTLPHSFLKKLNLTLFTHNECRNSRPNIWVLCRSQLTSSSAFITMSEQFIAIKNDNTSLVFVHAKNNYIRHRSLWQDLLNIQDSPICILGDFNVVLGAHE